MTALDNFVAQCLRSQFRPPPVSYADIPRGEGDFASLDEGGGERSESEGG